MPEDTERRDGGAKPVDTAVAETPLARLHAEMPGLAALLAEAQQTWVSRARDPEAAAPGWRPFEDAFPTFYQFTNRPR
jgi:hypothetical protein